jgi:hypothetical protein
MRSRIGFTAVLASALLLALSCEALANVLQRESLQGKVVALSNQDVLDMLRAGVSAEVIVAKIRNTNCSFDTSPAALKELKAAGVPDSVLLAMVEVRLPGTAADGADSGNKARMAEILADREKKEAECPKCKGVILYFVDSNTHEMELWRLVDNQRKWIEQEIKKGKKEGRENRFWLTRFPENADYVLLWSQATGSESNTRIVAVPHIYDPRDWAARISRKEAQKRVDYEVQTSETTWLDVVMAVYDAHTSEKVYQSTHRGNWRWSKPEKDCLADAIKFLRLRHP